MKKQKIEKRPTRARRAVKSVVIMFCALLICNMLSGGHLTRAMALRDGEQRYGVYEKTHEITSLPAKNIYKTLRVTLMASENVTYCGTSHFYTLLGWQDDFGVPLDCSDGENIYAGWWDMARNGVRDIFYWGRVDDAAVDSAVIERYRAVSQDENGDYTFEKHEAFAAELIEDGDYRYFLTGGVATEANYGDYGWDRVYFVGYDASGAEVLRYEIERQMSTSFA